LLCVLCDSAVGLSADLRVGFGEVDITPEIGKRPVYIAGFGHNRKATGVADPLMARAVVLSDGKKKIAIASVDVVGFFHANVESVRKQLAGFDHVIVTSTHNHEGPDTLGLWGATAVTSGVDDDYIKMLEAGIAKAVQAADKEVRPVTARIGTSTAPELLQGNRE